VTAAPASSAAALSVDGLIVNIGQLTILHGIWLKIEAHSISLLLGANGAGKTTFLRTVAGLLVPRAGRVTLFGESIAGRPPHLVARARVGHVPSGRELFPRMTVADHLRLGGQLCAPERRAALRDRVLSLFPAIATRLRQEAGTLSGGEQQMVAIARALMTDPKLLLLDEPSAGLAPKIVQSVFQTLPKLQGQGVTVLLAEQSLTFGQAVADRAYILREGRVVLSGTPADLAADPSIVKTYLGA
jgi:branched-chain amino acid transport system ATP-binding protein